MSFATKSTNLQAVINTVYQSGFMADSEYSSSAQAIVALFVAVDPVPVNADPDWARDREKRKLDYVYDYLRGEVDSHGRGRYGKADRFLRLVADAVSAALDHDMSHRTDDPCVLLKAWLKEVNPGPPGGYKRLSDLPIPQPTVVHLTPARAEDDVP